MNSIKNVMNKHMDSNSMLSTKYVETCHFSDDITSNTQQLLHYRAHSSNIVLVHYKYVQVSLHHYAN